MVRGILAFSLILATGCQSSSSLIWQESPGVSGEAEALLGRRAASAFEGRFGGVVPYALATDRMDRIGRRLATANAELDRPWEFRVLASDKINAFSLPGGLIYITRGLYERRLGDDTGLLAAVVAHEMGHVVRQDSIKRRGPGTREALNREVCADRCAARYLAEAGYGARCLDDLLRLIKDIQPEGWAAARLEALAGLGDARSTRRGDRVARR